MSHPTVFADLLMIQLVAKARSRWAQHTDLKDLAHAAIAQSCADLANALGEPVDIDGDGKYFGTYIEVTPSTTPEQAARKAFTLLGNVIALLMQADEALDEYAEATQAHIDLLTKKN